MKARLLRQLLGDPGYSISNHQEYIAVGSALCHDLISVNKKTLALKYALDAFREGRNSLKNDNLIAIWDKLCELINTGQINDVINGKDIIETPLPVYTVTDGRLVESVTDSYGWPNTDDNGIFMYDNTHFSTKVLALEAGIRDAEAGVRCMTERVKEIEENLKTAEQRLCEYQSHVSNLKSLLNDEQ